ncbi:MAG TPA: hypothetical protein VHY33_11375 [Thermoanaerobaculia bacterium]|jgi:hypothetical protein|nr:hypothetical protein [Thermoanaerobaculia bacterium]
MLFTTRYPIEPHGPKRLVVTRRRTWSEIVLRLDGVEIGRPDRAALLNRVEFTLRDHSVLCAWIEYGPTGIPMLYLTRNGHPLPGSEGDPVKILRFTLGFIWVIGACQIAFSILVISNGRGDDGISLNLAAGLILVLLGFLAWGRSVVAMVLASLLVFGELALLLITEGNIDGANVFRLLFGLGLFGWILWRGIRAVHELQATTLPVRYPPEPMHHVPPPHHPADRHDDTP